MIQYPVFKRGATIGVSATSSGVKPELHPLLRKAKERMEKRGYRIVLGETVWTQEKAKSTSAEKRAAEWMKMMENDAIDLIFPPWGGERLIEILEHIDFDKIKTKWVLGYSDTSTLLLAMTLKTGIATAHGTNFIDLRGEETDETTAMWEKVLSTETGGSITQRSSQKYQRSWQQNDSPRVFHLTEETRWKTVTGQPEILGKIAGRLDRRHPAFDRHPLRRCPGVQGKASARRTDPLVHGKL